MIEIETPIEKAKRLTANDEVHVSSYEWRQLVTKLLLEVEARDLAVADACLGEYGDTALISTVMAAVEEHKKRWERVYGKAA